MSNVYPISFNIPVSIEFNKLIIFQNTKMLGNIINLRSYSTVLFVYDVLRLQLSFITGIGGSLLFYLFFFSVNIFICKTAWINLAYVKLSLHFDLSDRLRNLYSGLYFLNSSLKCEEKLPTILNKINCKKSTKQ